MITLVLHNLLRWVVVLAGIWAVLNATSGFFSKRAFSKSDNVSSLLFMISCDIQLLLGLILYFSNGWFTKFSSHTKEMMSVHSERFFGLEHALMMIIAWVLVHVGRTSVKKAEADAQKHKRMLIYFGLAFLLIMASIPWPFRSEIARPLFNFGS